MLVERDQAASNSQIQHSLSLPQFHIEQRIEMADKRSSAAGKNSER